jgi:hypothetical protein
MAGAPVGELDDIAARAVPAMESAGTAMLAEVPVSTPAGGVRVGNVVVAVVDAVADVVTGVKAVNVGTAGAVGAGAATGVVLTLPPLHAAINRDKAVAMTATDPLRTFTR